MLLGTVGHNRPQRQIINIGTKEWDWDSNKEMGFFLYGANVPITREMEQWECQRHVGNLANLELDILCPYPFQEEARTGTV